MDAAKTLPLTGLRVLDCSTEIAGPYAAKMLVDAGADVIKVEAPAGDPLRRWTASGSTIAAGDDGVLFKHLNAGKRGVVVDLEREADRERLRGLAAWADIVVESFAPGVLEQHSLGYEDLARVQPALAVVSITPWGKTGPWAERPATEFTLQAAVGSTAYRGLPDRKPVAAGGRFGEWATGAFAAVGAISAWLSARASGRGQHVDVSMFESVLLSMTIYHDLTGQWVDGPAARAIEIPSIEPAKDGWIGFCTITGQQWVDFCRMIGRPEVAEDKQYLDGRRRMEHLELMQEMIHGWTRERTIEEMVELASLMRIPVSAVGDGATVPTMDHFVERGIFSAGPDGTLRPRPPFVYERCAVRAAECSPRLGEHDEEVAAEAAASPRPAGAAKDAARPLDGLRVVDLTAFWAGPFATGYLAAMGADVVKVESIQRPDGMRFAGAIEKDQLWERSPVFHGANCGKRDVTLQLDSAEGMALLKRLIEGADVVIESYSPRVLDNFGLAYDDIKGINPSAIMVRMPAFGLDGPWRDRTGFAMTLEQVSGLAWITGYHDIPLVIRGGCDPVGGMHAVFGLLMALEHRRGTGEGQLVEVPLVEVALNVAAEQVLEHSAYAALLTRDENRGPCAAPQGLYRTAGEEAYVALAVASDEQWRGLRKALGDPEWMGADDLDTANGRRARHDEIDERLEGWTRALPAAQVVERLLAAGVPAAEAINAHYVHPNEQLDHRGFFEELTHPVTGKTRYPGYPMRFSAFGPSLYRSPPPTLGQHTEEVLAGDLGVSKEETASLRDKKVIGTRPTFM